MRFIRTTHDVVGEEPIEGFETQWWLDTARPLADPTDPQKYVAVETQYDEDPNNFVPVTDMRLLFTDQEEYYAVCEECHEIYSNYQWSGSTRADANWRQRADEYLKDHQQKKGWCEFCDPIFGNGGWTL